MALLGGNLPPNPPLFLRSLRRPKGGLELLAPRNKALPRRRSPKLRGAAHGHTRHTVPSVSRTASLTGRFSCNL